MAQDADTLLRHALLFLKEALADGTVVAVGNNQNGQCDVSGWKDVRLP